MTLNLILLGIYGIFQLYFFIMLISIILSWIPGCNEFKICRLINNASGWYMDSFRGKIILGIFDFGTLIGLSIYQSLIGFLLQCIYMV